MDIDNYKKYVRDVSITDDDLTSVMQDVINEIARDTKIFKEVFGFTVSNCTEEYNMKNLFNIYSSVKEDSITSISLSEPVFNEESVINLINQITSNDKVCNLSGLTVGEETTTINGKFNNYVHLLDVITTSVSKSGSNTEPTSSIGKFLSWLNGDTYILNSSYMRRFGYGDTYSIPVIGVAIIVPQLNDIDEDMEMVLRPAIIAGLKYYVSDMYMNMANEQVSDVLYRRFYVRKKQLMNDYPNNVSVDNTNHSSWNK